MSVPSGATRDPIRVLVADSNQTQSQLLSSALRRQHKLRIACCRNEISDCLYALSSSPFDICLLGDGPADQDHLIETLHAVHANHPRIGLILLLDSYDRNLVVNTMHAGVRGLFCRASQPFRALCRCISVVHQGQYWANTEQMGYLIEAFMSSPSTRIINCKGEGILTPREEQIVNKVGGRFKLSTLIQKRLVALNGGSRPLVEVDSNDTVLREYVLNPRGLTAAA